MTKTFKFIALMLSLFVCTSMIGCNSNDTLDTSSLPNHELYDTANLDNLSFTPTEIAQVPPSSDAIFSAKDGNVFLIVKFDVENISEEKAIITTLGMFTAYVDGKQVDLSIKAYTALNNVTQLDGSIAPNETKTGHFIVEVPKKWQEFKIVIKSSVLSSNRALFTFNQQI